MRRWALLGVLALLFCACSKKKAPAPPPPPAPPTPVVDAAKPAPPPPPPRVDPTPALKLLFPVGPPQVPTAYRGLMPGVSGAKAKADHANLLGAAKPLVGADGSASVVLDLGTDRVRYLRFELPPEAEKVLSKAWGPGRVAKRNGRRAASFWFSETAQFMLVQQGLRLRLEVWPYTPLKTLLGVTPADVGGLVGLPVKAVRKRFADSLWKGKGDTPAFVLPPTRFYTRPVVVHLTVKKARAQQADFRIAFGAYPEQEKELTTPLLEPWGTATNKAKLTRAFKRKGVGLELRRTRGARAIYQVGISRLKKGK